MKANYLKRIITVILTCAMVFNFTAMAAHAEEAEGETAGKYVSDVFIAYGKTEEEAAKWLTDNGWEPVKGDPILADSLTMQYGKNDTPK